MKSFSRFLSSRDRSRSLQRGTVRSSWPSRLRRGLFLATLAGWLVVGPLGWAQDDAEPAAEPTQEPTTEAPAPSAVDEAATTPGEVVETTGGKIIIGKIDDEISLAEAAFVNRLIDQARLSGADVIALELNTFGGRVDAAVAIRDALMDAPQTSVVYINKRAISAGALISLACDKIAISTGGTIGAATPIQMAPGEELAQPVQEKYLSYFRQEMRSTAEAQGRDGDIAEAMVDSDFEIEGVVEKGKLLTLTTTTALSHHIADIQADTMAEALTALGFNGEVIHLERSWSEQLVAFLTSQAIASLLFMVMMVLAYLEWQTPGFGVFGGGAIACFMLLYFSHYMVNLAGYEELVFFGIGTILLALEVLVIPGFGIPGILGILCILTSMVLMLSAGDWSDFSFENPFTKDALNQVAMAIGVAVVAILALLRFLPRTRYGGGIVLESALAGPGGFTSHEAESPDLVGETGVTVSSLRPSGKAKVGGKRIRVETEGDFLDENVPIKVVRQVEGRVIVRKAAPDPTASDPEAPDSETSEPHEVA